MTMCPQTGHSAHSPEQCPHSYRTVTPRMKPLSYSTETFSRRRPDGPSHVAVRLPDGSLAGVISYRPSGSVALFGPDGRSLRTYTCEAGVTVPAAERWLVARADLELNCTHRTMPCGCTLRYAEADRKLATRRPDAYAEAIHAEAAYDGHSNGLPHDLTACGMPH